MAYRVRRNLPDNSYVQVKSTTKPECKRVLRSIRDKWQDVADLKFGDPFEVEMNPGELLVTQGGRVVDHYVIEEAE